jgi:protein-disulfide isomerase-like protein with CxxC motif
VGARPYASSSRLPPASRALLAFWAAEAARQQGVAAFDRFRLALFHRRHRDGGIDFSVRENFHPVAHEAGLDLAQFGRAFADRALLEAIQRDYEEARATHKVFGVPTLCYDPDNAIYLKLQQVPPPDDTLPLFEELRRSITTRRWLSEIKRPNPSRAGRESP